MVSSGWRLLTAGRATERLVPLMLGQRHTRPVAQRQCERVGGVGVADGVGGSSGSEVDLAESEQVLQLAHAVAERTGPGFV